MIVSLDKGGLSVGLVMDEFIDGTFLDVRIYDEGPLPVFIVRD